MILETTPSEKLISVLFKDYVHTHIGELFFFSVKESDEVNVIGNNQNLRYETAFDYAKSAIQYLHFQNFTVEELYEKNDVSVFYSIKLLYQHVSIDFINKMLKGVFNTTFEECTEKTKKKSDLPVMYMNGDNPFDITKHVYVYKSKLHQIVIDFVLYYLHNVGCKFLTIIEEK